MTRFEDDGEEDRNASWGTSTLEEGKETQVDSEDRDSSVEKEGTPKSKDSDYSRSPIPDGGLQAWLQVLSGFLLYLNSWGVVTAFGVFQSYYGSNLLKESSSSTIAW